MTLYIVKRTSKNKSIQINRESLDSTQDKYLKLNINLVKDYHEYREQQHRSNLRESIK